MIAESGLVHSGCVRYTSDVTSTFSSPVSSRDESWRPT
jgi:hypothetical protein